MVNFIDKSGCQTNLVSVRTVTDEINACSIVVPVEIDYGNGPQEEEWLVFFKNETHNHPTET